MRGIRFSKTLVSNLNVSQPAKKREFFDSKSGKWSFRDESTLYVTIDKLEDFQYFVKMVKKTNEDVYNGQTIFMVDDDNNWELEIYDGYRG